MPKSFFAHFLGKQWYKQVLIGRQKVQNEDVKDAQ